MKGFFFIAVLFFILAGIVYQPSFHSPFLVDDNLSITSQGKYYEQGPWVLVQHFWNSPQTSPVADRPVVTLTLWLDYKIGGFDPLVYKITNILLHTIASFLVFIFLRYLCVLYIPSGLSFIPLAGALIFLLHPIHTQVINIVVQRSVTLMTIFGLLGFYSYLRFFHENKKIFLFLSWIFLILAILSKAPAISFVFIILLYVIVFAEPKQRTKYLISCVPALLFLGSYLLCLYKSKFHAQYTDMNSLQNLVIQTRAVWIYWKLFLFPYPLHFLYDFSKDLNIFNHFTWLAIIGHLGVIGGAIYLLRQHRYKLYGFCILCAYLSVIPEALYPMLTNAVMEYRSYVAFIFLSFAAVMLIQQSFKRVVLYLTLIVLLIIMGAATFYRNSQINTIEKWHYDMVMQFQSWDTMNFYALDLLTQAGDMNRTSELLGVLAQKRSQVLSYAFLKDLTLVGPKQSLQDNLAMLESNRSAMTLPEESLTPFFLNIVNSIVVRLYPANQKDMISHQIFFNHLFHFRSRKNQLYNLKEDYQKILFRLKEFYDQKSLLTPKEEWEKEKVLAAITILDYPKGPYFWKFLQDLLKEHPNWQAFF